MRRRRRKQGNTPSPASFFFLCVLCVLCGYSPGFSPGMSSRLHAIAVNSYSQISRNG
jgi:hypothetical protein